MRKGGGSGDRRARYHEHQAGLAVDIIDVGYPKLNEKQASMSPPEVADGALLGVIYPSALSGG